MLLVTSQNDMSLLSASPMVSIILPHLLRSSTSNLSIYLTGPVSGLVIIFFFFHIVDKNCDILVLMKNHYFQNIGATCQTGV